MSRLEDYNTIKPLILRYTGQVPTIPSSEYKSVGDWLNTDLYLGQFANNIVDDKVWYRTNSGIIEIMDDSEVDDYVLKVGDTMTGELVMSGTTIDFNPSQSDGVMIKKNGSTFISSPIDYKINIGIDAGSVLNTGATSAVIAIGYNAGANMVAGGGTFIGYQAQSIGTGVNNTCIGKFAGTYLGAGNTVCIGDQAGYNNIGGTGQNINIGNTSGYGTVDGAYNTNIGNTTQFYNNGNYNVALGFGVMRGVLGVSTASSSIGIGYRALYSIRTGNYNCAIGHNAGYDLTTGQFNLALGYSSLRYATSCSNVTAIGAYAGLNNNSNNCTFIGYNAGYNCNADGLTYIGAQAGQNNSTGNNVIGIGYQAGKYCNGSNNMFLGNYAGIYSGAGIGQVAIGQYALGGVDGVTSGSTNIAIGASCMSKYENASLNVVIGASCMGNFKIGDSNTIIGTSSCFNLTGGTGNVVIGRYAAYNDVYMDNKLVISNKIVTDTSTSLIYGDFSTGKVQVNDKLGIGVEASVSRLHIASGSTTIGQIHFENGDLTTTPENGTLTFSNDRLYLTNIGTHRAIDRSSAVVLSSVTVANKTGETTLFTAPLSGSSLRAGNFAKLIASGTISSTSAADLCTIRVKVGTTTYATLISPGKVLSSDCWHLDGHATIRTIGTGGTIASFIKLDIETITKDTCGLGSINTTTGNDITVTAQWNNAKVGNTITIYNGILEFKN